VLFKLMQFNKARIKELYDFCLVHPNIFNYIPVMGNWQMMLDIEMENGEKVRELSREMKYKFKDVIYQIEINEIYEIDKFSQMVIEYPELMKKNIKEL